MNSRKGRMAAIAALTVVLVFVLALVIEYADAASADQDLAGRKGLKGSLETKEKPKKEGEEGPTKVQMAIGVGSLVVAIIVIKWL